MTMYYVVIPEPLLVRDKFIAFTDMKIYAITYNNFLCSNGIKTEIIKCDGEKEDVFNIIKTSRISDGDREILRIYKESKGWGDYVDTEDIDILIKLLDVDGVSEYFKLKQFDGVISNTIIHGNFQNYLYRPESLRNLLYNLYGMVSNSIIAATLPYIKYESSAITKLELLMNQRVKDITSVNKTQGIMSLLNTPEGSNTKFIWEHLDVKYFYTWYMKRLLKIQ